MSCVSVFLNYAIKKESLGSLVIWGFAYIREEGNQRISTGANQVAMTSNQDIILLYNSRGPLFHVAYPSFLAASEVPASTTGGGGNPSKMAVKVFLRVNELNLKPDKIEIAGQ